MDASDYGLCALDPAAKEALTHAFTVPERQLILEFNRGVRNGFDINYRELLSCAFAVHAWGTRWSQQSLSHSRPLHVHFRIDNASAVEWQNKLASRNPRAQVIIRLLSWWETSFRLRFSASHIAGINNVRADAGSRSPADPSFAALFASLNAGWLQVSPQVDVQGLTNIWQRISEHTPFPTPPSINTGVHYPSGKPGLRGEFGFGSGGPIRSDSIMTVLQGVRHFFAAMGYEFLISPPHTRMLLKGIGRLDRSRLQKAPASLDLIEACFRGMTMSDPFEQALRGVLCLAFFFLLRRSENVAISGGSFKWFALRAQDIVTVDANGIETPFPSEAHSVWIRLVGSKTNQGGAPITRMLS
ncbi:hypothetical protein F442_00760 [Phytophthora nicotianae P10297]|uniref:Uncharacterized protein n=1 Tax=Phytophthora nicotianae P10297 TaxID=1317064 RepID=W3A5W2_PHYNI|nr:hypothetical protein F442_00760 [Phytophthora nicotianae P10297]